MQLVLSKIEDTIPAIVAARGVTRFSLEMCDWVGFFAYGEVAKPKLYVIAGVATTTEAPRRTKKEALKSKL